MTFFWLKTRIILIFIDLTLNARLPNYMLTQHQQSPLNKATHFDIQKISEFFTQHFAVLLPTLACNQSVVEWIERLLLKICTLLRYVR